jgi:aerobic-type carbon monoxide dehydrogenase small subunit (CoxS/CutS family)
VVAALERLFLGSPHQRLLRQASRAEILQRVVRACARTKVSDPSVTTCFSDVTVRESIAGAYCRCEQYGRVVCLSDAAEAGC